MQQDTETTERPAVRPASFWQNLSGALTGNGERRLFGRRGANTEQVKGGRMETATVIGFCEILGMTHVRYDLRIDQPGLRPFEDGPRVLGIKTFLEHFSEPVGS